MDYTTLDTEVVGTLQRHWEDGWNRGDLDTIMAPFADEVVFSSPAVAMVTGEPDKRLIEGAAALREYVAYALGRTPGIAYTLDATYVGSDDIVILYTCTYPDGRPAKSGADTMRVNDARQDRGVALPLLVRHVSSGTLR